MKSANRTTLIMFLLAAVSVVTAMYYFPWPEFATADEEVGKPLFDEYEVKTIRGIEIIKFNSDQDTLDRIKLVRRGEQWEVPAKQNYVASLSQQVGSTIISLNDRTVYAVESENQEDHIKYGVVDPTEYSVEKNVASLGQKLTLTNRNNKVIANVIVGLPLKNDPKQRYVRIPGKPRVYVIEFDANVLATDFRRWVSPDVLMLQSKSGGANRQIREISIDNYIITKNDDKKTEQESIYRATLVPGDGRLNVKSLRIPIGEKWKALSTTATQQVKLTNMVRALIRFETDDVRSIPVELVEILQSPGEEIEEKAFASLQAFGFYKRGIQNGAWDFDSANGEVSVTTTDGVKTTILIGQIGAQNSTSSGKVNYYVMLNATVDERLSERPERPVGVQNDESDENKAYLRLVEQWKTSLSGAEQTVNDINAIHGEWFYLVSQDVIEILRPEIQLPKSPEQEPSTDAIESIPSNEKDSEPQGSSDDK